MNITDNTPYGLKLFIPYYLFLMAIVSTSCGDNEKTPIGPSASFTISPLCDLVPAVELINTSQAHDGVLTLSVWSFSVSSMLTVILQ